MANGQSRIGIEPAMWFLIFETKAQARWLRWLALGRFKHVSALGWVPDQRLWVHYDVSLGRTRISVLPDCPGAVDHIATLRADSVMVAVMTLGDRTRVARLGFWCVPAIAHLVGLAGILWRPDALYRASLAQGGSIVDW